MTHERGGCLAVVALLAVIVVQVVLAPPPEIAPQGPAAPAWIASEHAALRLTPCAVCGERVCYYAEVCRECAGGAWLATGEER